MTEENQTSSSPVSAAPPAEVGAVWTKRLGFPLLGAGVVLSAVACAVSWETFGFAFLIGFLFLWSVSMGALFFVAMHHLTHAVWSVVVRRVMEMMVSLMPALAGLFVVVLLLSGMTFDWMDLEATGGDPIIDGKRAYLNRPFFILRAVVYFVVWIGFGLHFVRVSLRQDSGVGGVDATRRLRSLSAPFTILFGLTLTFAAFDWMMSLEAHWFSTIFGVYVFAGVMISGMSACILLVLWLRQRDLLRAGDGCELVREPHLYHMGTLLFATSCFWGYIAMSQLLLLWYANLPEETFWFAARWQGGWKHVSLLLMFVRFVVPFLVLLSRAAKTRPSTLAQIALFALFGQILDIFWIVMPQAHSSSAGVNAWVVGPLLFVAGVFFVACGRFLSKHSIVAAGDPLFDESRRYRL